MNAEQINTKLQMICDCMNYMSETLNDVIDDIVSKRQKPTQLDYTKFAGAFIAIVVETVSNDYNEIMQVIKGGIKNAINSKGAGKCNDIEIFGKRILRNADLMLRLYSKETIKESARNITDFWTDSEILDIINDVKVLNDIKNVWTNDKDTGFAQVPQEYRPAAIAGNYGEIIERKIDFVKEQCKQEKSAVAPKQPQRKQQYQINQEEIKTYKNYFTDEFVGNNGFSYYKRFIDDLTDTINRKRGKVSFATLLLQAMKNTKVTTDEVRKMSVAEWFRLWQGAFNIDKLQYKENQLYPDKLKDQTIYKYLFD